MAVRGSKLRPEGSSERRQLTGLVDGHVELTTLHATTDERSGSWAKHTAMHKGTVPSVIPFSA